MNDIKYLVRRQWVANNNDDYYQCVHSIRFDVKMDLKYFEFESYRSLYVDEKFE